MFKCAYISNPLDVHPREAPDLAATWHRGLRAVRGAPRFVRLGRSIWLAAEPQQDSTNPLQLYGVRGVLWVSGRPIPFVLEFLVWSDERCEVGVCPRTYHWPVGSARYVRRVVTALHGVCVDVRPSPDLAPAPRHEHPADPVTERATPFPALAHRAWAT